MLGPIATSTLPSWRTVTVATASSNDITSRGFDVVACRVLEDPAQRVLVAAVRCPASGDDGMASPGALTAACPRRSSAATGWPSSRPERVGSWTAVAA